jgi:hypothetical protein
MQLGRAQMLKNGFVVADSQCFDEEKDPDTIKVKSRISICIRVREKKLDPDP